ncbi:spermidine/putrescine ABC transporter substrate-binding protein [Sorangium sp. So ce1036]|uniref:polyamine ABC transporter substrate-binding protein n=1 Tax=Sorangium sp. So ce1036 TaxID=3133328 RepID=UPI003EFF0207
MQTRRRPLMLASMLLGALSLIGCSGCSKKSDPPSGQVPESSAKSAAPADPGELNLLIFPDYIDEKIVKAFEEQTKARVRLTRYDSTEEMESKLAYAGADSQYDVVIMASQVLPRMVRRGLVRPLEHAKIPNLKNLEPRFSGPGFDDGNKHGVPYQWGTVGVVYNKKKLPNLEPSWSMLLDPQKLAGTFVLLDEQRDMLGAVLKYKGFSSNTSKESEIREAGRVLKEVKKQAKCLGFKGGVGALEDVKAGSVDMAVVWNGDAQKAIQADKERLAFVIPKEGSVIWVDVMTIAAKAPNPELAHKFINHVLTPEGGAQLSMYTKYASPNAAAQQKLPDEDRTNTLIYPTKEVSDRLEHHRDLGEAARVFDEVWTDVKSQ